MNRGIFPTRYSPCITFFVSPPFLQLLSINFLDNQNASLTRRIPQRLLEGGYLQYVDSSTNHRPS